MRRDYFTKLSWAARWYLPGEEAAEVLEDYREIVKGRSEEELRRDLGTPRAAMRQLAQPKVYRRWVGVFGILSVCIVLPAITPLWQELSFNVFRLFRFYWFWDIGERIFPFSGLFYITGTALSLVWFRRGERRMQSVPKGIWPLLAVLLVGMAWVWFLGWAILMERWDILHALAPTEHRAVFMRLTVGVDSLAMGVLGVVGLVKSRISGHRWGGVYVLGLAGVILSLWVWGLFNLRTDLSVAGGQTSVWVRYLSIILLGFIGTGVSLC